MSSGHFSIAPFALLKVFNRAGLLDYLPQSKRRSTGEGGSVFVSRKSLGNPQVYFLSIARQLTNNSQLAVESLASYACFSLAR